MKQFYEYLDMIVYINLDKRVDRNKEILDEFKRASIPSNKITRLSAIYNIKGAIGCTMSHIKTLQMILTNKWKRVLILEDDFNFIDNIKTINTAYDKFFNYFDDNSWDVVNLSRGAYQDLEPMGFDFLSKVNHVSTTSAYMVNLNFCEKLLTNFKEGCKMLLQATEPRLFAIDIWWKNLQQISNWYIFNPSLGYQRDSFSDIESRVVNYTVFDKSIEFKNRSNLAVRIKGGLGNQMFQIATLYAAAKDNNLDPIVEKVKVSPGSILRPTYWDTVFSHVNTSKSLQINNFNIMKEPSMNYNKIRVPHNVHIMMDGYFQSPKYFDNHRDVILELFKLPNNIMKNIEKVKNDIISKFEEKKEIVSVHVRRGDYMKLKHVYNILEMDYYNTAMVQFKDCNFVVFSEDIIWCKDNFKNNTSIQFIENINTNVSSDVTELYLMSMFDHNIIANSSFSWWGAWMNNNPSKMVIAPKVWYSDSDMNNLNRDIYCNDWILV
jgi:GR25 family glycosyltransferase involved in LPS biosynthesis